MKNWMATALLLFVAIGAYATPVRFYEGDLLAARQKAIDEDKLFFVDFHAQWCMPCKWMDQTTFSDNEVGRVMSAGYISVKLDIDELEGFDLAQKYDVQVLPTILIFNNEGQMVERIEETLTPTKMLKILRRHSSGKVPSTTIKRSVNRSPRQSTATVVEEAPSKGYYRLQMGAFTQYESASKKVLALQEQFLEPIVVVNDIVDGQVIFKIMMGHFASRSEADSFREILKVDFGLDSLVQ